MFSIEQEVEMIYQTLMHPAMFDVGCCGVIFIRPSIEDGWIVEWEEYSNPHDNACKHEFEYLGFEDAHMAAECFVDLRRKCHIGDDFDCSNCNHGGYYMLGNELIDFKRKWSK